MKLIALLAAALILGSPASAQSQAAAPSAPSNGQMSCPMGGAGMGQGMMVGAGMANMKQMHEQMEAMHGQMHADMQAMQKQMAAMSSEMQAMHREMMKMHQGMSTQH